MSKPWIELEDLKEPSSPYAEYAIDSASMLLWALSGRKYSGLSTTTEMYVCPQYETPLGCSWTGDSTFVDHNRGIVGHVLSILGSDSSSTRFPLRHGPVREVLSVSINDEPINETQYYLENHRNLVINETVLACSGLEVEYRYGVEPPSMGKLAAIILADNIIKDLEGESCDLPQGVTSVTRQGMSFEIYNPQQFLDEGRLGIFIVDAFLSAVNPAKAKKKPKVFSADMPRGRNRKTNY